MMKTKRVVNLIDAEFRKQVADMRAAFRKNPRFQTLYEEIRSRKAANCEVLESLLDKIRMLRDNKEWKTEQEENLICHFYTVVLAQLKKRCPKEYTKFTTKWSMIYIKRAEEALYIDRLDPKP
jgi:hypothetical protein